MPPDIKATALAFALAATLGTATGQGTENQSVVELANIEQGSGQRAF